MSQQKSDYFSNVSNIYFPRVVLEKIDIPENSIIISTIIETPLTEEPAAPSDFINNDYNVLNLDDEVCYKIHSIEYICQDCYKSFSSAELHKNHVLSCHTAGNRLLNIPIEYLPVVRLNRIDVPEKKVKVEINRSKCPAGTKSAPKKCGSQNKSKRRDKKINKSCNSSSKYLKV
ncbi:uncharacterized protein LOC130664812 [Microplitis mediator]|uniref:uncharacterized protein LOC130664812 n=1 Tax=Microplitis mediator TaxID=375433 RepID=UPI00255252B5|nr:uncharacterized protein LOC130664812 [Microplitis mediator]XP_057320901.1 uncharacterized protein LOC130664812 [Microplitis mediator]